MNKIYLFFCCLFFFFVGILTGYYLGWNDKDFYQKLDDKMMEESGACDWAKKYVKNRCSK